ncbi:MAG TPA: hypothetical protein VEK75_05325 [Xanthobacteraceae bacterium]|nr:hypothetical protein [Xanthobacteraceae bacterium]
MPYTQANGTTDGLPSATSPDSAVRAVEREARAVEREARALEREAGGWPFAGPTFQDLRTAAQTMIELCRALEDEDLSDEQRQFVADDVVPVINNLISMIQNFNRPPSAAAQSAPPRSERK